MTTTHRSRTWVFAIPLAILVAAVVATWTHVHAQQSSTAAKPPVSSQTDVTWSHDIAPIAFNNCTTCHHTSGAGPFSLLTYQDARRWAPQIVEVTKSRYMPPWLPEHMHGAAGYVEFQDERGLPAAWRKSIAATQPHACLSVQSITAKRR
jgi:hypothetical protein